MKPNLYYDMHFDAVQSCCQNGCLILFSTLAIPIEINFISNTCKSTVMVMGVHFLRK